MSNLETRKIAITQEESQTVLRALSLLMVIKRELGEINQSTLTDASKNPAREELVKITRLMNLFYW
jgi:hypothetical protein